MAGARLLLLLPPLLLLLSASPYPHRQPLILPGRTAVAGHFATCLRIAGLQTNRHHRRSQPQPSPSPLLALPLSRAHDEWLGLGFGFWVAKELRSEAAETGVGGFGVKWLAE